jgi:Tat protein translocase TatC
VGERNPQGEMPFLEHLEELRWRILYSLLAIAIGTVAGWVIVQQLDVLELLKRPIAPHLPQGRLTFTSPTEPLLLTLKLAFSAGLLLASPVVIYQAWAFLAPALYPKEKRLIVPALSVGVVLFAAGAAAAYRWALPAALDVLFSFQREDLAAIITIDKYFGFAIPLILAFGAVTELPLVIAILAALGLVTPRFLARNRRYALVIAAFGAALLTPPDAVSMLMMMVPLVLLYEISILSAWIVTRRRERAARAAGATVVGLVLALVAAAPAAAQQRPLRPPPRQVADTPPPRPPGAPYQPADSVRAGRPIDTATARRLGLPTGPSRSFPTNDPVLDSLLRLPGFVATRYVADTLIVQGDSQVIVLRGAAFIEREGTQLEADSVRYRDEACRLDAVGRPRLFDESTVLVGEAMRYDTCIRRGIVTRAVTNFEQSGVDWFMRGTLAVDSGSTRLFGVGSEVTSCDLPDPHFHFAAGKVKWLNRHVMVARPAVLYVRDIPILWMPFIFQDIRSGRRSGMLVPRFGLNDLVRTSPDYDRHVSNVGYYWAISDYVDLLAAVDWFSGSHIQVRAQSHYRVLNHFVRGGLAFTRISQLDEQATSTRVSWNHQQQFSSRTSLTAAVDYATDTRVVQSNTINPYLATATLNSRINFTKRFPWGDLALGGTLQQNLSNDQVTQTLPELRLAPSPIDLGPSITWSPSFALTNNLTFRNPGASLLVPGPSGMDTLATTFDRRATTLSVSTPLRLGRWNWSNSLQVTDGVSNQRLEVVIPDSTAPGGSRTVVYGTQFATTIDWQTGINLPQLFSGTWKLQPGVAIVNQTGAGPFMLRNQFSGGEFVRQGKRLQFSVGLRPSFFGFFPGIGPLARIRHTVSPSVDYRYAPGSEVDPDYVRAVDPTGRTRNARTDPQQTISLGLNQNFEAKLRVAGDSAAAAQARKIRLLSISTTAVAYNFEQAKDSGRTGWATQEMTNSLASDLLPGFQVSLTHDLWDGTVGFDSTRFDPFLKSISASFQLGAGTFRALAGLFGVALGGRPEAAEPPTPTGEQGAPGADDAVRGFGGQTPAFPGAPGFGGFQPPGAGGRAFTIGVQYSSTRQRDDTVQTRPTGGARNLNLNVAFSPTRNWSVSWTTSYDLDTEQFGQHYLRFERDLHRWRASFAFVRSANGNVAFNFYIALTDLPDIKFDYDQQTYQ